MEINHEKPDTAITLIIEAKGISVDSHESSLWDGVTLDATGNTFYLDISENVEIGDEDMYIVIRDNMWRASGVLYIAFE